MSRTAAATARRLTLEAERTAALGKRDGVLSARLKEAGWVLSHGTMQYPILPGRLREAAGLYQEAFDLEPQGDRQWQRALLLMDLGDFEAAIAAMEACATCGDYLGPKEIEPHIHICRELVRIEALPDVPGDARAKLLMGATMAQLEDSMGAEFAELFGLMNEALGAMPGDFSTEDEDDEGADPLSAQDSDAVCAFSEAFVQALVDARYEAAHQLLSRQARSALAAENLQREFTAMTAGFAGPIHTVEAEPPSGNMPDMAPGDIAWVYVGCSSDHDSEAVSFIVCREDGELRAREIEWGQP